MRLVEQHVIKKEDPRFNTIDEMAFASKNLWNLATYFVRQPFLFQGKYLNTAALYSQLKATDARRACKRGESTPKRLADAHICRSTSPKRRGVTCWFLRWVLSGKRI